MRITRIIIAFTLLLLFTLHAGRADSATVLALSLEDMVARANLVVVGTVTDIHTLRDAKGRIVRDVSHDVEETIIGRNQVSITVRIQGGELDGIGRYVPGEINPTIGATSVLFLERIADSTYRILGLSQGRFIVLSAPQNSRQYVARSLGNIRFEGKPQNDSPNLDDGGFPKSVWLDEFVERVKKIAGLLTE